jgi:hypothetical protein
MMAGTLRVRRSQGALSGVLLVLLGIWGALIPFVGPYFHYAYTPDKAFDATAGRMWLEVLPGVVTLVCGLVVLTSRFRPVAVFGAWLAALAGAWFAVGGLIGGRWTSLPSAGVPVGGRTTVLLEQIGIFTGLGVVIVFVAALVLGRFTVVAARDAQAAADARAAAAPAETAAAKTTPDPATTVPTTTVPATTVPTTTVPAPRPPADALPSSPSAPEAVSTGTPAADSPPVGPAGRGSARASLQRVLPRRVVSKPVSETDDSGSAADQDSAREIAAVGQQD